MSDVRYLTFPPGGNRLVVSGRTSVQEYPWDLEATNGPPRLGPGRQLIPRRGGPVEYSRDGRSYVACQLEGLLVKSSLNPEPVLLPMSMCNWASVSPDGKWAAASPWAGRDSDVRVWELPSGREVLRLTNTLATVQFTRDGSCLVLLTRELIECRAVGTWQRISHLALEPNLARLALSTDSRWCALQQGLQHILLCELPTFRPILTLDAGPEAPVCFSPDNTLLLTRRSGGQFCLWDLGLMRRELTAIGLGW